MTYSNTTHGDNEDSLNLFSVAYFIQSPFHWNWLGYNYWNSFICCQKAVNQVIAKKTICKDQIKAKGLEHLS